MPGVLDWFQTMVLCMQNFFIWAIIHQIELLRENSLTIVYVNGNMKYILKLSFILCWKQMIIWIQLFMMWKIPYYMEHAFVYIIELPVFIKYYRNQTHVHKDSFIDLNQTSSITFIFYYLYFLTILIQGRSFCNNNT